MQDTIDPKTYVSEKSRGEYVTRLSLKANDAEPRIGVYFLKPTHALLSMFHPSIQNWLMVKNADPDVTFDIHLDTFYLRKPVKTKYEMADSEFQRLILAGADVSTLEAAALADCSILGYDAMTIKYPVHFDLTFLREQGAVDANFGDLDGLVYGTMFCQPDEALAHVRSFKINVTKFLGALRTALTREIERWGPEEDYESRKPLIIQMSLSEALHNSNQSYPFLKRTFVSVDTLKPREERFAIIPPTGNLNPFTDLGYSIPRDVLRLIALNLSLEDILRTCLTSKSFDAAICYDDTFWREKLRTDYPKREATKQPNLSWKEFYQRVAGRDGLLGVMTGYKTLQLIGVIGFLSNVVVVPRDGKSFNLAGLYWRKILDISPWMAEIMPQAEIITASSIWYLATGENLSKFAIRSQPVNPADQHFKPDSPGKYDPLTHIGSDINQLGNSLLEYIEYMLSLLEEHLWVLNLPKFLIDDYLEAFLVSPEDDFSAQLTTLRDYKNDEVKWRDILGDRLQKGLLKGIPGSRIIRDNVLFKEYFEQKLVYDERSAKLLVELIQKKIQLTRSLDDRVLEQ